MRDIKSFSEDNRMLVADLRDPDPEERLATLVEISDEIDDELTDELERMLHEDPDEEVRARVPISLGPALELCYTELDDEGRLPPPDFYNMAPLSQAVYDRLVETLRRVYLDGTTPELVRRRVLEGAIRSPQPWQKKAVAAAFRSGKEPWQITAVFCMGHLRGFDDEIVEAFESGSEQVRFEAIRAAGERGIKRLGRPLLALAADPAADPDERVVAIWALPNIEAAGTLELLDTLSADPEEAVAEAAEDALDELSMLALAEEMLEGVDLDEL